MGAFALVELFLASLGMLCLARIIVTALVGEAENGPLIARWGAVRRENKKDSKLLF